MPTVLIVDDRPANRQWLATLLKSAGHRVIEAGDGVQALEAIDSEAPEVVLTDILMPRMDGYELVRRLRAGERDPDGPLSRLRSPVEGRSRGRKAPAVILISAHYTTHDSLRLAEQCGVYQVLDTPVEPQLVLDTVARAIAERERPAATSGPASREVGDPSARGPGGAALTRASFREEHLRLLTDTLARKATQLELSNARLTGLLAMAQRLTATVEPRQLLSDCCRTAAELTGAQYAMAVVEATAHGSKRHVTVHGSDSSILSRLGSPAVAEAVLDCLARGRVRADRLAGCGLGLEESDDPQAPSRKPHTAPGDPGHHEGGRSSPVGDFCPRPLLIVPIETPWQRYGALVLAGLPREEGALGLEHGAKPFDAGPPATNLGAVRDLAVTIASQTALGFENAMRYEEIQAHAQRLEDEVARRRRAQEEVSRLNADLEKRVTERTSELERSHALLRQRERMASLGTLCAGLGHDMGNLLLPIRARLEALEAGLRGQRSEIRDQRSEAGDAAALTSGLEHIVAIEQCLTYLQNLTDGLRLLSVDRNVLRDETSGGRSSDQRGGDVEQTDLSAWQREVAGLLRSALPSHIALDMDLGQEPLSVDIDRHRLTQAVFNLVHNSAEAMRGTRAGRIVIRADRLAACGLGLEEGDDPQAAGRKSQAPFVRLTVSDDGPGMDESTRRRAMDPFFTTKQRDMSTGLGLSLVHGIISSAGGECRIESTLGAGTTVILLLPQRLAACGLGLEESADPSAAGHQTQAPSTRLASVTIADARLRALATSVLRSIGFEVVAIGSVSDGDIAGPDPECQITDNSDTLLWLTEPHDAALLPAQHFLALGGGRRVAVVGRFDERWSALGAFHLGDQPRPSELCAKVQEMMLESKHGLGTESDRP